MSVSDRETRVVDYEKALVRSLVEEGLYEKEARAMVNTWQDSWFQEDGLRVLYLVPAYLNDQELPLTLDPKPSELVRVLVGRLDIFTPEREAELMRLFKQAQGTVEPQRLNAFATLKKYGRLSKPAWARVKHLLQEEKEE